jgi:hypothetical protein
MSFATTPTPDGTAPSIVQYPTINYAADTIDVTFSEQVASELVTNGEFASNTNYWGAGYSAQLDSVAGGQSGNSLRITENGDDLPFAVQNITCEIGKVYKASAYVKAGTETDFKFYAVATQVAGFTSAQTATSSWAEWSFTFTAWATSINIVLMNGAVNGTGDTFFFDEVSIKEVTDSEEVASELVTNGEFSSNTNYWGAGYSAQLDSVAGGQSGNSLRITENGDDFPFAVQTITCEIGKVYKASVYVKSGTETEFKFYAVANQVAGFTSAQTATNSWTRWSFNFTAWATGINIVLMNGAVNGTGDTFFFDEVSIKEVTDPGSLEITTLETDYSFSPSLLFGQTLGGSDDISYLGNNTYRLSMSSIPANTIFTMTVSNITDAAGNPVTPNFIRINDNDNDGLADDWEAATGVGTWSGDPDSDGLNNLEEFNNGTNPNNLDTDGDTLPDLWEVVYGLDPTDSTGADGRDGDFDGDGWTNSEEYVGGYDPSSSTSPAPAAPPEIRKSIPRNNSGITNSKRVPTNTSFAVRLHDLEGIDITDTSSIEFTINDGVNPAYTRSLSNPAVFRVVKLTTDNDDQVKKLWAVYDRSLDTFGNFQYDANVNITVNAKDRTGIEMVQESFQFNVESSSEQITALDNEPYTSTLENSPSIGVTTESIDSGILAGAKVIYDNNEPIKPKFGPVNEVPVVGGIGITPAPSSYPINLEPPTVFNNPVTIFIPIPKTGDVSSPTDDLSTLSIALYDGESWVVACDANGNVTPAGDGWMVPGSRVNHSQGFPPSIELQVYHFSAIQAAVVTTGGSASSLSDASALSGAEGGGGCFIGTMGKGMNGQKILVLLLTFALGIVCIFVRLRRTSGDLM